MISRRKLAAMVLFLLMSLFMFTFANPGPTEELGEVPVITVEPALVKILEGTDYDVMTGVSVTDDRDTLIAEADITDTTDLAIGEHTITYTATDEDGNEATATRTIEILDPDADEDGDNYTNQEEADEGTDFDDETDFPDDDAPVIVVTPALVKIMPSFNFDVMTGVSVTDDFDVVTVSANITDTTLLPIGDNVITYTSTLDRADQLDTATRTIRVLDPLADEDGDGYTNGEEDAADTDFDDVDEFPDYDNAPTITQNNINEIEVFSSIPLFSATANDVADGEVDVAITHNIVNDTVGTYTVTFTATDSLGNVTVVTMPFNVVDTTPPIITLVGEPYIKVILGLNDYSDQGSLVIDLYDLPRSLNGVINGNPLLFGEYTIVYNTEDANGNVATEVVRTIKVLDPKADEDGDGYTNEEEYEAETDYDNIDEYPDYDNAPTIIQDNIDEIEVFNDIPTFTATATDVADGEVDVVITDDIVNTIVGTYTVTFTATDSLGNVTVVTMPFNVVKREITVSIEDKTSVFKSPLETITYVVTSGTEVIPNAGIVLTTTATETSNVGEYPITGTYSNDNYDVTFEPGTYTITKKALEESDLGDLAFVNGTFGYNGTSHKIEVTGLPSGLEVEYTDNTRTNAGSNPATATISGDNYSGSIDKTATITVNKALVTVTAEDKTSVYGDDIVELTYTLSMPLYGTDSLNIDLTTTATETSDVGEYPITGTYSNDNYDVTFEPGTYTITKKALEESDLGDLAFVNGTFGYNGTSHKIEVTGLPSGLEVEYTNNTRTNAGSNPATAKISGDNYSGSIDKTATITVNKALVTVTAEDKTSVYGDDIVELTYTLSMPLYGTDSLNIDLTTTATETSNVGEYPITGTYSNDNYDVTFEPGTYTITKKALEESDLGDLAFVNGTFGYNGTSHKIEVTGLPSGLEVEYTNNTRTNAGSNPATAKISGDNYSGSIDKTATITVNKALVTVTAEDKTSVYGDDIVELTYTLSMPLYGTDSLNIDLTTTATETSNVGEYPITGTYSNDNYDVTFEPGTYTITAAVYTITYNLDGGIVSIANPTSYDVTTPSFTLNNPTKEGYDFVGWSGTGIATTSTTVVIAQGTMGNLVFTANFIEDSQEVVKMSLDYMILMTQGTNTFTGVTFKNNNDVDGKMMEIVDGLINHYADISKVYITIASNSSAGYCVKYSETDCQLDDPKDWADSVEYYAIGYNSNGFPITINEGAIGLNIAFKGWGNIVITDFRVE
jgi:uncharacterized repeat protein (TIGR02543 family)